MSSAMYAENKSRWLGINWVKNYIIEGFCPMSHGEKEWVRANWRMSTVVEFPVTGLHNQAVKHKIIEMYSATTAKFKEEMAAEIGGRRLLHLNLDLWVDKFSSLKYIGKQRWTGKFEISIYFYFSLRSCMCIAGFLFFLS